MKQVICNVHNCNMRDCPHAIPHEERVDCSSYTCRIHKIIVECIPVIDPFEIKLPEDLFEL